MFKHSALLISILTSALLLSACQINHPPAKPDEHTMPSVSTTEAKGEWWLAQIIPTQTHLDLQPLHYRISLRITSKEFSVAAPCSRLLGVYQTNATLLRFRKIESRDIVCRNTHETPTLKQLLERTRSYRVDNDQMHWQDANGHTIAVWQRIYL